MRPIPTNPFVGIQGFRRYKLAKKLLRERLQGKSWLSMDGISVVLGLSPGSLAIQYTKSDSKSKIKQAFNDLLDSGEIICEQNGRRTRYKLAEKASEKKQMPIAPATPMKGAQEALEHLVNIIVELARQEQQHEIAKLKQRIKELEQQKEAPLVEKAFGFKSQQE